MALVDSIIGAESGGDPSAQNPSSSAMGLGQFIGSTWLDMLAKHRPDLAELPREAQLALRADPSLSRAMTQAYADQNGAALRQSGFEPTPGNTYLAHFAGPAGATAVLGADPTTPVSSILKPDAVAANPFLRGMTAADLQSWASRKVGGSGGSISAGASASPGSLASAPPVASPAETEPNQLAGLLSAQPKKAEGEAEGDGLLSRRSILSEPTPTPFDAARLAGLLKRRKL